MVHTVEIEVAGRTHCDSRPVAWHDKQTARFGPSYGDTVVLATDRRVSRSPRPASIFFPHGRLSGKFFAAGKIPGGYFKREARPSEKRVLTSRLIDRALRPALS